MKLVLLFAAILIGVTFQQPPVPPFPQRCFDSPPSWSGNFFIVDYAKGKSNHGYVFYNRTEGRVHFSYDSYDGTPDYKRVWIISRDDKVYTFDGDSRTCTSEQLRFFPTFGAPRDSEFIHHDRLGSYLSGLGVTTDYFRMESESGGYFHGYYSPLSTNFAPEGICVPVIESYENIDTAPNEQSDTHFTFLNITTDHINGLVWDIPRECYQ